MGEDRSTWQARRREAASTHAESLRRREEAESAQAREMLAEFVRAAEERGIAPVRLQARSYGGRARYRTDVLGWYLKRNETVAVGTDGRFYVLSVPPTLAGRFTGVSLEPSDPPLVLGKGGRDGESIDLADALRLVLEAEG